MTTSSPGISRIVHAGMVAAMLWVLLCLLVTVSSNEAIAAEPRSEYELKAAFLLNFAKFVEWPDGTFSGSADTVVLGILGEDPFGLALDRIVAGQLIRNRTLSVRRLTDISEITACNLVFIAAGEGDRLQDITALATAAGILTVGETTGFAEAGVVINFYLKDRKVRFEINARAAELAQLRISSRLLRLARIVDPDKMSGIEIR
jgi:hypothetical protein